MVDRPTALRNRFEPMPTHELQRCLIQHPPFSDEKKAMINTILLERSHRDAATEKQADLARQDRKIQLDEERNRIAREANTLSKWAVGIAILALIMSGFAAWQAWFGGPR